MKIDRSMGAEGQLLHTIIAHAGKRPYAPAFSCGGVHLTWEDFAAAILDVAGTIAAEFGERKQQPVALVGVNSAELVIAYLAIVAAGQCAVPLPVSANAETLAGMLSDCRPNLVFTDRVGFDLIGSEGAERIVAIGFSQTSTEDWNEFAIENAKLETPVAMSGTDDFNIIYSSGTTARPKGIVQSHAMRYRQAARATFGLGPASTMLLATPLYSNTTLMPLLATLCHGGNVVLMQKFSAAGYLDLAEEVSATHTMLVPIQYQRLLGEPDFVRRDLSAFVVKQSTGAPLASAMKRDLTAYWPGKLLEVYGLTEGGCTSILDVGAHPDCYHTVGRPAPGNDIRIIDEAGTELPAGEVGEIVGCSPTMMTRYFRNPQATEAFYWRDAEGQKFHRTGDIGLIDEAGFLVLRDRKKDVIISGGFNVYASDLERVLLDHPDIEDAAVIAVPSQKWGETPLGLVVMKEGVTADLSEVCAWANGRLGSMQRLSRVEVRPTLPRSPAGKMLKQDLKKPYWA